MCVHVRTPHTEKSPKIVQLHEQSKTDSFTAKNEMSDIEEVRRVFGVPCPSTVRVKILVGEIKNLKFTGAVLKRLMADVPPPAKVRSFPNSFSTISRERKTIFTTAEASQTSEERNR